jgi:hypothetical protein
MAPLTSANGEVGRTNISNGGLRAQFPIVRAPLMFSLNRLSPLHTHQLSRPQGRFLLLPIYLETYI